MPAANRHDARVIPTAKEVMYAVPDNVAAVDQILAEEEVDGGTADLVAWTLTDHLNTVRDIARLSRLIA